LLRLNLHPQVINFISENELFATEAKDIIEVETIMSEAKVLTLEEMIK